MAIFTLSVRKHLTTNNLFAWSNVYHVEATDILSVEPLAEEIMDLEATIHSEAVTFSSYRISDENGPLAPVIRPQDRTGELATSGDLLPAFVAVRVDLSAVQGRPGRKFYHCMLAEADQNNGLLEDATQTIIQDAFNTIMPDFSGIWTNPTGAYFYTGASVQRPLTMHQFKRKWSRRGAPP